MARAVAGELGLRVISADAVRQSLFGPAKQPASYGQGVYTDEANHRTYQTMIEWARTRLSEDGAVVLDATFSVPRIEPWCARWRESLAPNGE